jgi:hypothetical protein
MKLAIIGSGPIAIQTAVHFHKLGAEVILFQKSPLGGGIHFSLQYFPDLDLKRYWENEIIPLIEYIETEGIALQGEVLRVHKRFLSDDEEVAEGRTRLTDLFRVVYSVNPSESILKQVEENPEIFKQLGEEVLQSLHIPVESFIDFDLVIEATGTGKQLRMMGPGGVLALNENNLKNNSPFYYEKEIFSKFSELDKTSLVLVGEGPLAEMTLMKLTPWLFAKEDRKLYWIRHTTNDISGLHLAKVSEKAYEKQKVNFEEKLREWRDLEDYIKVKIPIPIEPFKKLTIYSGFNVTSVDKLLDKNEVFVTIESPDFRKNKSELVELKTLAVDAVLVSQGYFSQSVLKQGMREIEPGYYQMDSIDLLKDVESNIMSFFHRASE